MTTWMIGILAACFLAGVVVIAVLYVRLLCGKRNALSVCSVAIGEIGVKSRIKNALAYKKPMLWVVIVCLILCVALGVMFLTEPKSGKEISDTSSEEQSVLEGSADRSTPEESLDDESTDDESVVDESTGDESSVLEESVSDEGTSDLVLPEGYMDLTYVDLHDNYNPDVNQKNAPLSVASYNGGAVVRLNGKDEYRFVPDFSIKNVSFCGMERAGVVHLLAYENGVVRTAKTDGKKVVTDTVKLPQAVQNVALYCQMVTDKKGYVLVCNETDDGVMHVVNSLKTATGGKQWNAVSNFSSLRDLSVGETVSFVQFFDNDTAILACKSDETDLGKRVYVSGNLESWRKPTYQLEYPYWVPENTVYDVAEAVYRNKAYYLTVEIPFRDKVYEVEYKSSNLEDWLLSRDAYVQTKTKLIRNFEPENLSMYSLWDITNSYLAPTISCTDNRDGLVLYISAQDEYIYIPDGMFMVADDFNRLALSAGEDILLFTAAEDESGKIQVLKISGTDVSTQTLNSGIPACFTRLRGMMFDKDKGAVIAFQGDRMTLLVTDDGGKTWEKTTIGDASALAPDGYSLNFVQFFDRDRVLLAWDPPAGEGFEKPDVFVITRDGGKTWERVDMPLPDIGTPYGAWLTDLKYTDGVCQIVLYASPDHADSFYLEYSSADLQTWTMSNDTPERPAEITRGYVPPNLSLLKFYSLGSPLPDGTKTVFYADDRGGKVLHIPAWDEYVYLPYSAAEDWYGLTGGVSGDEVFVVYYECTDPDAYVFAARMIRIGKTVTRHTLLENLTHQEMEVACHMLDDKCGYLMFTGIDCDDWSSCEIAALLWTEDGGKTWTVRTESALPRYHKERPYIAHFFDKNTFVISAPFYIYSLEIRTYVTFDGGKTWERFETLPLEEDVRTGYLSLGEIGERDGKYWMRVRMSGGEPITYFTFESDDLLNWVLVED